MKNTIITIVIGIFLLVGIQAMYSGETIYTDLQNEIQNLQSFECNLTAENYNLDGANFTTNETGYILSLDINFKPDNLTISCLLNGQKWIEDNVRSLGGGGGGGGCYTRYECSEWTKCGNGNSTRSCTAFKEKCHGAVDVPKTVRFCPGEIVLLPNITDEVIEVEKEPEVIEDKKSKLWIWLVIIGLGILIIVILLLRGKK